MIHLHKYFKGEKQDRAKYLEKPIYSTSLDKGFLTK